MKQFWYILFFIFLVACKPLTLDQTQPILFVSQLNIGVYEYNAHTVNIEKLFLCDQPYCKELRVASPSQTKQVFEDLKWTEKKLLAFLDSESYTSYKDQKAYHMMLFFFQSNQKNYVRIVNAFTKTVKTQNLGANSDLSLLQILQDQKLFYVSSEPAYADLYVATQLIGEAPLWLALPDGNHNLTCKLPGQESKKKTITSPGNPIQRCNIYGNTTQL